MPSSRSVVLDTHAWLWWVGETSDMSRRARATIDAADAVVVPAICVWEVALLADRGRVRIDPEPLEWMRQALAMARVAAGPLSPEVASEAASLRREGFHSDPADRLIYATARVLDAVLVSDDGAIRAFENSRPSRAARHLVW
jgi:PIN domain nuclease of toxin-antitoxin system